MADKRTLAAANELVPTGTLRAAYIEQNPVQAFIDPATKEVRGPGAEITRALAQKLGVPFTIMGAQGVPGVIDKFLDEARSSGLIAGAIARAGLAGVDVAPPRAEQWR